MVCLFAAAGSGFLWLWEAIAGMSDLVYWSRSTRPLRDGPHPNHAGPDMDRSLRSGCRSSSAPGLFPSPLDMIAAAILAAALVTSLAWLGHAGASEDGHRPWMLACDVAHLLAAGVWPAGLLPFALLLRRLMKVARCLPPVRQQGNSPRCSLDRRGAGGFSGWSTLASLWAAFTRW